MQINVGIITISDRAAAGDYADLGGPALKAEAEKRGWNVQSEAVIPDELNTHPGNDPRFQRPEMRTHPATGGTGITARDVTPEAIRAIMRVELPGFGEAMRMESMKITPNAILSRSLAAVVDNRSSSPCPGSRVAQSNVSGLSRARFRTRSPWRSAFRLLVRRTRHSPWISCLAGNQSPQMSRRIRRSPLSVKRPLPPPPPTISRVCAA